MEQRAHRLTLGSRVANRNAMLAIVAGSSTALIGAVLGAVFSARLRIDLACAYAVVAIGLLSIVAGVLQRARLSVDAAGIRIERAWRRERFVAFDLVERVSLHGRDLSVVLRDGETIRFHARAKALAETRLLAERIEETSKNANPDLRAAHAELDEELGVDDSQRSA